VKRGGEHERDRRGSKHWAKRRQKSDAECRRHDRCGEELAAARERIAGFTTKNESK
jgi:hypothetical protein